MPLLLARIDDRLIHGQVAFGWGRALRPTLFLVVSDTVRFDSDRSELCLIGVPEEARGRVLSVAEALDPALLPEVERERTLLVMPGTAEAERLLAGGFPIRELNVGGLHHAPGKHQALPYVFLDESDRARLSSIAARGVHVMAQDLPGNPVHPLETLTREPA